MKSISDNSFIPVFIIGVPRSGTTLLRILLDSHSKIAAAPETPWILGGYGKTSLREIATYLTEDQLGPVKNLPGENEQIVIEGLRAMIKKILTAYLEKKSKDMLILKTPDDMRYIEFLLKLYPSSTYLHIYRDGRDVACSTVAKKGSFFSQVLTDYGELNYDNAMRRWYEWEQRIRIVFKSNEQIPYIRISYEELVMYPEETMKKVCMGLGVSYEKDMLNYVKYVHEYPDWEAGSTDVKEKIKIETNSIGRWQKEIKGKELVKLESNYGNLLEELGYKLSTSEEERSRFVHEGTVLKQLQEQSIHVEEKIKQLHEKSNRIEEQLRQLQKHLNEKDKAFVKINQKWGMEKQILENEIEDTYKQIRELQKSLSWKITAPLRAVHGILTRTRK